MNTEAERFLGIGNDRSVERRQAGATTRWWLASLLLPVAAVVGGTVLAVVEPDEGSDWFRGIRHAAYSILLGSILSLVSAAISFAVRERKAPLSLLLALPSLGIVIFVAYIAAEAPREKRREEKAKAEYRQRENALSTQIHDWAKKFKDNPKLITSDAFWEAHNPPDRAVHYGLLYALNDKSFVITPEIKAYIIGHFPGDSQSVLAHGRASIAELELYANDTNCPVADTALEILMRDRSFEFTDHYRQLALKRYPRLKEYVFGFGFFTKEELEQMMRDPSTQQVDKFFAERALKQNSLKNR